ncbi:MAG: restriction endonuclease [Candidatus Moeniiplasma glomeromycotorum]|nr:restriction endonuclease [Candidatus Moeniiplasma glomeromycotorum]MCE8162542.1 restriction endonuclease [Candidatus Moeniiplasma glomeromycotorum]MCE8166532.1 restriction endonuclease [Candidatus Moeniiplasma glomeromycotorum]MCE8166997.1 restriction endonuclease [Candidatus Moeniiplasma glomeromycotorum]
MREIIDKKYEELNYDKRNKNNIFWKIREFEANAIGQIGEEFVREIFKKFNLKFDETKKNIHDEYDILLKNGIKIEVKTARKGKNNDTFQFNGINPRYTPDFIVFVGILENDLIYRILSKSKVSYRHKGRKFMVDLETTEKQLVKMNPNNEVNFKLTLNKKELKDINSLENELNNILENDQLN